MIWALVTQPDNQNELQTPGGVRGVPLTLFRPDRGGFSYKDCSNEKVSLAKVVRSSPKLKNQLFPEKGTPPQPPGGLGGLFNPI